MAIKTNSYNFSNDLQRIGSSLANAMIGDAQDDAAIALAKYRDAQTAGQELANRGMRGNLDAIDAAASGNIIPRGIAKSLGYDVNNGNLIQPVMPGGPQRSVPAFGSDQVNMDGNALMTDLGNIARTLFGDGTSTASQVASALDTLGGAGSSRLAESMILGGNNSQAQRGALLMAPQGGQYQNPGFAMAELLANDATARRDDDLDLQASQYGDDKASGDRRYETDARYGKGGQGDRDTKVKYQTEKEIGFDLNERRGKWERYKADQTYRAAQYKADTEQDTAIYGANLDASVARDNNVMDDSLARWKHNNREIEMSIEPGKVLVLDPDTANRLNIAAVNDEQSRYNGLHVLNGGPAPGKVVVKVGREDVYMDQATAEAIGAKKDDNGQYVIKGVGYKEDASTRNTGGSSFAVSASDDKALREAVDRAFTNNDFDLPDAVTAAVRGKLVDASTTPMVMGDKKNISRGVNYIASQLRKGFQTIEQVVPGIGRLGGNDIEVQVPVFLIEEMNGTTGQKSYDDQIKALPLSRRQEVATIMLERLGYKPAEAAAIVSQTVK